MATKTHEGEPTVSVFLPLVGEGNKGVSQIETVTVTNAVESRSFTIMRGRNVDVPVPVYEQLIKKFPNL